MNGPRTLALALLVAVLAGCASTTTPPPESTSTAFYAITRGNATINSALYHMDEFGVAVEVGDTGFSISTIKFNPVDGMLYGITRENTEYYLLEIDVATGAASESVMLTNTGRPYTAMAFRDDGALFVWNDLDFNLYSVDVATGATTPIVPVTEFIASYSHAMWFDADDVLWLINGDGDVWTLDTTTGAESLVHDADTWVAPFYPYVRDFHMRGDLDRASGEYWGVAPGFGHIPASAVVRARIDAGGAELLGVAPVQSALAIHQLAFPR